VKRNVLVIKLGALGDLILAFDAFQAIRVHHSKDHITLLTRPAYAAWARQMPWFDEVWDDPSLRWWQWGRLMRWRKRLRAAQFHRIYDLQGNDRTALYYRLLGSPKPEWSGPVRGCSHPRPDFRGQRLPAYERLLQQLESAGVPRAGRADLSWLDGDLSAFPLPERYVVLVPGSSPHRPEKRWPPTHYAALAERLRDHGIGSVAVGTHADQDAVAKLCASAPAVVNLIGQTHFGQLAALARQAVAVIGNDTGPVHLTAAVGAPTLVLYSGVSDPERMRPHGPHVAWLQQTSLAELSVEEVWHLIVHLGWIGHPAQPTTASAPTPS